MRFHDKGLTETQVIKLIEELWEAGITSHHSSFEYSSYELYVNALKKTSVKNEIKHISKLSSPHFEDDAFSGKILEERVDAQLKALNIDCIDVLQWLVRSKPINDTDRLQILQDKKEEIQTALTQLKNKGKIKSVFSFPYSTPFAEEVIKLPNVDGIISYLNTEELAYAPFANQHPFIAIRPLFAGKLVKEEKNIDEVIQEKLSFVAGHEKVLTTIVGINSEDQIEVYKKHLS